MRELWARIIFVLFAPTMQNATFAVASFRLKASAARVHTMLRIKPNNIEHVVNQNSVHPPKIFARKRELPRLAILKLLGQMRVSVRLRRFVPRMRM